jgi:hypothetical protein
MVLREAIRTLIARFHTHSLRGSAIMAFHETAMTWFAHDFMALYVAGGFHGNPRLRSINCGNRNRLQE